MRKKKQNHFSMFLHIWCLLVPLQPLDTSDSHWEMWPLTKTTLQAFAALLGGLSFKAILPPWCNCKVGFLKEGTWKMWVSVEVVGLVVRVTASGAKWLQSSTELQAKMKVSHKMVGMNAADDKRLFLCSLSKLLHLSLMQSTSFSFLSHQSRFLLFPLNGTGQMPTQHSEHVPSFSPGSYNAIKQACLYCFDYLGSFLIQSTAW